MVILSHTGKKGAVKIAEKLRRVIEGKAWAFHASDDSVVDVQYARNIITALLDNGGNVRYSEHDRGVLSSILPMAHFEWVPAYENEKMNR